MVDLKRAPRDDVCVPMAPVTQQCDLLYLWLSSSSVQRDLVGGCCLAVASRRRIKWRGDGGLAAEVGEDATIVGGARGCRFSSWRR